MGLISTALNSVSGVMSEQWKEYFYCDSIDKEVIVTRGFKKTGRGSSNRGSDNIISNGSVIAVADGQCMIIVDNGKVVEFCAEPGEFVYDSSTEPSLFSGKLGDSILATFKEIGKRFTFGGQAAKDQRVYFFNTKELTGGKYGTANPVPFRVVDRNAGIDIDISIRCFGEYSIRVTDPILFYTNVSGNIASDYRRSELESQLKTELLTALQPAFAKISDMGIRYSSLPGHTMELAEALNEILSKKWRELRGIEIVSFGVSSVKANEEDEKMLKEMQRTAAYQNANLAAAAIVNAQADAMRAAASNTSGAMNGFMAMNMATNAGGMDAANLFAIGQQQAAQNAQAAAAAVATVQAAGSWKCSCGATVTGKFCTECGAKKPEDGWTCSCGAVNKGKFCSECGAKKPAGAIQYRCDKCGWEPEDKTNPPKFCPECGDIFDNNDIVG